MRRKEPAASSSGPTSMQLKMGLLRYSALGSSLMRETLVTTCFIVMVWFCSNGQSFNLLSIVLDIVVIVSEKASLQRNQL